MYIKTKKLNNKKIPKLRFPAFSEDWEEKRLGEVVILNPSSKDLPDEFIYIDLESVKKGKLNKQNKKKKIKKKKTKTKTKKQKNKNTNLWAQIQTKQAKAFLSQIYQICLGKNKFKLHNKYAK